MSHLTVIDHLLLLALLTTRGYSYQQKHKSNNSLSTRTLKDFIRYKEMRFESKLWKTNANLLKDITIRDFLTHMWLCILHDVCYLPYKCARIVHTYCSPILQAWHLEATFVNNLQVFLLPCNKTMAYKKLIDCVSHQWKQELKWYDKD